MKQIHCSCWTLALALLIPAVCWSDPSVDLLKKLVEQNSGSKNAAGVNAVQSILKQELESLGFSAKLIHPPEVVKTGDLLVAELPGQKKQFITLIVHADTVFETSSGFIDFKISDDGHNASGPGVIDEKGGAVIVLSGLREYLKSGAPAYSLRVISSPSEEIGSPGFFDTEFKHYAEDSILVLGFEPALGDGNIVSSRRGIFEFIVNVQGREAHSGRAHKQGINACVELAHKIIKLAELTDYSRDVTINIGHIEGGQDKFNVVCGFAQTKADARFATAKDYDRLKQRIAKVLKNPEVRAITDGQASKISFEMSGAHMPFEKQKWSQRYAQLYLSALQKVEGKESRDEHSGGAADTNAFVREGLPILDGLGAVGAGMHTNLESISLQSLDTRAKALALFLDSVGKEK